MEGSSSNDQHVEAELKQGVVGRSILMSLPEEVKQKIWTFCVAVDYPITPSQISRFANKFHPKHVYDPHHPGPRPRHKPKHKPEQLTAVQLSKVSRQVYAEIAGLFYRVNQFYFTNDKALIVYLAAITSIRRNAITSIGCFVLAMTSKSRIDMFAMIASCRKLQTLTLILSNSFLAALIYAKRDYNNNNICTVPGFREIISAVRGIKELKVNHDSKDKRMSFNHPQLHERMFKSVKDMLEAKNKLPRVEANGRSFLQAVSDTRLHVHGDGRLDQSKKPSIVASRTRGQLRAAKEITADGIIPGRKVPMFNLERMLAWDIIAISDARASTDQFGQPSVEFYTRCAGLKVTGPYYDPHESYSSHWIDISVIVAIVT